jgi:hypothetical protein
VYSLAALNDCTERVATALLQHVATQTQSLSSISLSLQVQQLLINTATTVTATYYYCWSCITQIWDLQFLFLDGDASSSLSGAEVLSMLFVDPYPLLITGDSAGNISLIPVRPCLAGHKNFSCLKFSNDPVGAATMEGAAAVTNMALHFFVRILQYSLACSSDTVVCS